MAENKKRLVIIDGKSVFYRGYYAMPNLNTKDGTSTGGVYGFAVMALEVLRKLKPDYVCVAWDKSKTNIRKRVAMYPEYKAGRKPPPPDFYEQIPILHKLLEAFGWPLYELDDYEADDIMGTLAVQAKAKDLETMLVTSDLDVLQLVNSHTQAYLLKTGLSNIELLDPAGFEKKYQIETGQFLDYKALAGDTSDNIPGAHGIGKKTAIELLQKYKTIDEIYENLDLLKASVSKKLEEGRDLVYLSKKLAEIWVDAPLKLDLTAVDGSKVNPEALQKLLRDLEFRSLLARLPDSLRGQDGYVPTNNTQLKVSATTIVDSDEKLEKLDISNANEIVVHSRSTGQSGKDPVVLIISPNPKSVYAIKVQSVNMSKLVSKLDAVFSSNKISKVGYDIKSTIKTGYHLGLDLVNVGHDVLIGSFLLNPILRASTLNELAETNLGYEGVSLDLLDNDELIERANDTVAVIRALYEHQVKELASLPKVAKLAKEIEWPVIPVLARMEYVGIELDTHYLEKMSEELSDKISDIEQEIYGMANEEFNIGSPAQLANILFNKLKLSTAGVKKGKTGYSTAANELDKLRGLDPIIDLITDYRELTKLKNTYVDTLPKLVDENSRLHTTFNLTIAQTGRLSSTNPNLQNIPIRTEIGKQIRTAFVARPNHTFISADYSQFELRLAAYLAGDKELIDQFNNDADIHTMVASQVYNRESADVTSQMRRIAKVINFGILYGMSPHGLSVATGMTEAAAKEFVDKYYELRKPIIDYMNELRVKARKDGYVEDLFGRRRPTPDINSTNFVVRQAAERAAINMPIQGTEADLMKMAMIEIDKKIKDTEAKMLLQIHDSVLVECPDQNAKEVESLLKDTMEAVYKLPVKLTVDTIIGKNWGEL